MVLYNVQVILVEVLHNFGMVMLVLRVLPCFGGLYGLGIIHSICMVPSVLAVIFVRRQHHHRRKRQTFKAVVVWMLDVIAMLMSIAAVAMPIIVSMFNLVNVRFRIKFFSQLSL